MLAKQRRKVHTHTEREKERDLLATDSIDFSSVTSQPASIESLFLTLWSSSVLVSKSDFWDLLSCNNINLKTVRFFKWKDWIVFAFKIKTLIVNLWCNKLGELTKYALNKKSAYHDHKIDSWKMWNFIPMDFA